MTPVSTVRGFAILLLATASEHFYKNKSSEPLQLSSDYVLEEDDQLIPDVASEPEYYPDKYALFYQISNIDNLFKIINVLVMLLAIIRFIMKRFNNTEKRVAYESKLTIIHLQQQLEEVKRNFNATVQEKNNQISTLVDQNTILNDQLKQRDTELFQLSIDIEKIQSELQENKKTLAEKTSDFDCVPVLLEEKLNLASQCKILSERANMFENMYYRKCDYETRIKNSLQHKDLIIQDLKRFILDKGHKVPRIK
ncbi:hypothetical protein TetV_054 [Tetraselmis virus 1]|uniref:Uncharacterized protein n=1 Tax=Tetraselmis virus 1 TaxID=2060617 RepID=A0A2P0VMN4_9VIRU|nr:hypothetical protein QJ968_gp054 [Tetraselmis virus 1]AUF82146.1 hypothetical protein TetV_054 [Tetraselmis virus 1]